MFTYVSRKEAKPYCSVCSKAINQLGHILKSKYGISVQVISVGSNSLGLITKDENGYYDFDYNILIQKMPAEYEKNLKKLKNVITVTLNDLFGDLVSGGQDSTSAITYQFYKDDGNEDRNHFGCDFAIVKENEAGKICRLIHQKADRNHTDDRFYWNESKNSKGVSKRSQELRETGNWEKVKICYLNKKNHYWTKYGQDYKSEHPSYNIYVEAVNEVYHQIF